MKNHIEHAGRTYTIIPLEFCLDLATSLNDGGKQWHSHVLSPGCEHNPFNGEYAIIIEDDTAQETFIAPSNAFPEVDKMLVKMLHGEDILDPNRTIEARGGNAISTPLLDRLRDIDRRRVDWHHHMNFPSCVFNPTPGRWAITVESSEGHFHESYDNEPVDVLREVEVLYFRNLDRHDHKH